MHNLELLEQIAKEQIDNIDKVQIEYESNSIIIINTFLDELYNNLYDLGWDDESIKELLTTELIKPYYDFKLCFFKIQLVNILNSNNYNLKVLQDELKIKYAWIVHQLLGEIKKYEKIDNA